MELTIEELKTIKKECKRYWKNENRKEDELDGYEPSCDECANFKICHALYYLAAQLYETPKSWSINTINQELKEIDKLQVCSGQKLKR